MRGLILGIVLKKSNFPLQPTVNKLRFLPSAELARYSLRTATGAK